MENVEIGKLKLKDEKAVVESYYKFLLTSEEGEEIKSNIKLEDGRLESFHSKNTTDGDKEVEEEELSLSIINKSKKQQYKSIRAFLEEFNTRHSIKLDMPSVYRWLKADCRGDFNEWNGQNNLNNVRCKSKKIVKIIGKYLKRKFPDSAVWNKVAKSKSSPEQYGVFAKKLIHSGTMLGFYKGDYVVSVSPLWSSQAQAE
jgi:hypothetical protein